MKNLTNITSGTPLQRATIYFENDWCKQLDEEFLSESENTKLEKSLQNAESGKVFYQIGSAYNRIIFVLNKMFYLQSQFKQTLDMFVWVSLCRSSCEILA
jgi:hypothetical protein